jgi:hypothetical protein
MRPIKPTYVVEYKKLGKATGITRLVGRVITDSMPSKTAFIKAKSGKVNYTSDTKGKRTGIVSGGYVQSTYGR